MKQELLQLTGGGKKEKRRKLDFYPTPKNVTRALMEFLFKEDRLDFNSRVWEPACGNGKMSEVIKEFLPDVFSSDIRDTGYGSPFIDFTKHTGESNFDAIITNPPFNQSTDFIEVANSKARVVCMLLKSQYWHAAERQELFKKHTPSYILPLTWRPDFLEDEKKEGRVKNKNGSTMEVIWNVWIRGNTEAKYIPLMKPNLKTKTPCAGLF
jgi:hypothetical protein